MLTPEDRGRRPGPRSDDAEARSAPPRSQSETLRSASRRRQEEQARRASDSESEATFIRSDRRAVRSRMGPARRCGVQRAPAASTTRWISR